jgi:hypothetical protein
VIGIDFHRTFGEVVIWGDGRLGRLGRVDMTRAALECLGGKLQRTDEIVVVECVRRRVNRDRLSNRPITGLRGVASGRTGVWTESRRSSGAK